uniref:Uncharacterized protein n=1 Tax=Anguilla anguilla TaxID=7936 RepID=A0A0E9U2A0_ANGAN
MLQFFLLCISWITALLIYKKNCLMKVFILNFHSRK